MKDKKIEFKFYGEELIKYRKAKCYSQEDLANIIGVSRQTIHMWEANKSIPDTDNISKLCQVLNVNIEQLCSGMNNCQEFKPQKTKQSIKKLKYFILLLLVFFLIIFGLIVIRRMLILNNIKNKLTLFDNLNNYSYRIDILKNHNNSKNELDTTEVYYKDGILKMVHSTNTNEKINTIWINYNTNEGYSFDEDNKTVITIDVETSNFPKANGIRAICTSQVNNSTLINCIYAFLPYVKIDTEHSMYILKREFKYGNYSAIVEERINRDTGLTLGKSEYGNNDTIINTIYDISINKVDDEKVLMPLLPNYEMK